MPRGCGIGPAFGQRVNRAVRARWPITRPGSKLIAGPFCPMDAEMSPCCFRGLGVSEPHGAWKREGIMVLNAEILEQSFAGVAPRGEMIANRFYDRLFRDYPAIKPVFANADLAEQKKNLLASLQFVIANVRQPEELTGALRDLAHRHLAYGAEREHYDAVMTTLLLTLAETAGDAWTEPVGRAWRDALAVVKEIMVEAAYSGAPAKA
jgi:hemoglobin-like flavoprotein